MIIIFHGSLEGAQHGSKGLPGFLDYASKSGAKGAQPSNFMIQAGDGFMKATEIKSAFAQFELKADGISCHCPFWVHGAAASAMMLNGPITRSVRPFIPKDVAAKSPEQILQWAEDYILGFLDLCAELGIQIVPMFWGPYGDPALYTGYPWGFWSGSDFDMVKEFREQFVKMTQKIRDHARKLGIFLAHEIHPGTAACCADDFNALVSICDGDSCLGVNADPSHCWEGEKWETRFRKVGERIYGCHVKNFTIIPDRPLRSMESDWKKRGMQFTSLDTGDLKLVRYAELMIEVGYPQRYCKVMKTDTAPLVVEAESAFRDGDDTSAAGIKYVGRKLCFPVAQGSFEDAMGEKKDAAKPTATVEKADATAGTPAAPVYETIAETTRKLDEAWFKDTMGQSPTTEPVEPTEADIAKVINLPAQSGDHAKAAVIAEIAEMKGQPAPGPLSGPETRVRHEETAQPTPTPKETRRINLPQRPAGTKSFIATMAARELQRPGHNAD